MQDEPQLTRKLFPCCLALLVMEDAMKASEVEEISRAQGLSVKKGWKECKSWQMKKIGVKW